MSTTKLLFVSFLAATAFVLVAATGPASASTQGSGCIAHHPQYIEGVADIDYTTGCTGHDEPELDPVSNAPGSAKDMTWTAVLPRDGAATVDAVGPTFWFGGTVTDPDSLFGQAFYELQFYPNGTVTNCTPNGGFVLKHTPGIYTVCDPVWSVTSTGNGQFHEPAAFNGMLTDSASPQNPLIMHAGDTITVHVFQTAAKDGLHITVADLTHPGHGTLVLNSKQSGPLNPAYDTQSIGNALGWGLVYDTPNSFVWEIGHTSPFTSPASAFCVPGEAGCYSYEGTAWAGQSAPVVIKGVKFADGSSAKKWAVVSDFGGKAEVNQYCGAANYGGPFCIYPWYSLGASGFHYGVDYPDNLNDYRQADQFAQTLQCGGPFGADSTYCDTIIK